MNLRKMDLNLLVYFDALMQTRHVSRAAERLGVGQPAMSAALGRLRDLFEDPLLVREGNAMVPTERALALENEVRNVLRDIEHVIEPPGDFDPSTSGRRFRVRMSDLLTFLLMEGLAQSLEQDAPDIELQVEHLSPDQTVDALAHDKIDAAVSTGLEPPKSVRTMRLFHDTVVCVARRGLPVKTKLSGPDAFARMPQIRVSQSPLDYRFADDQLHRIGLERNVAISVPHWLAVPDILCSTSLVAAVPASFAQRIAGKYPLTAYPLDFFDTGFYWSLYWHARYDNDLAQKWFRAQLVTACKRHFDLAGGG